MAGRPQQLLPITVGKVANQDNIYKLISSHNFAACWDSADAVHMSPWTSAHCNLHSPSTGTVPLCSSK